MQRGGHTSILLIVVTENNALPVLVIDGAAFDDFAGFTREFSKLLCHHTWRGNLDAFNDILRGGFGTPETGWVLKWVNSDSSRATLGYEATIKWLEDVLFTCHPSNRSHIQDRLLAARRSEGRTLFGMIVEIIRYHGPGGPESEDGVLLELR
jgi:RNAse (barnase) inhibitor barstar